ncbi:MAG TPA: CHAT domain-containing tetratricopeptide repeat protein [Gemmatimonadaceae bacterium]
MLDERGSLALILRARQADPSFLPAELDYIRANVDRLTFAERRRAAASGIQDQALARCLAAAAVQQQAMLVVDSLRAIERQFGKTRCTTAMLADLQNRLPVTRRAPPVARAVWRAAVGDLALVPEPWTSLADAERTAGDTAAAIATLEEGVRAMPEALTKLRLSTILLQFAGDRGDSAATRAIRADIVRTVARDGRPGIRIEWLTSVVGRTTDQRACDSLTREAIPLAASRQAHNALLIWYQTIGINALDRGDVSQAVDALRHAAAQSDTIGGIPNRSRLHVRLGRALVKEGRAPEGIAELRLARALADTGDRYTLADIEHNLAHAYESTGVTDSALRAIDRFAVLAAPFEDDGIGVISLRDAGVIRWNAGLHASARLAFERMVRLIDQRHAYDFYAGEYFERIGDLARARHYYARVPDGDFEETARALAGSVRVFLALGLSDSAAIAARRHDRAPSTAEEIPLLPSVLVHSGQAAAGLTAMQRWLDTQSSQANAERTVRGTTHLAGLFLDAGRYDDAANEATRAAALAKQGRFVDDEARAMMIYGAARLRLHRPDDAAQMLTAADSMLRGRGSTELAFELAVMRGDALAAAGRRAPAFAAYERATTLSARMRSSFDDDLDQARIHAEQIAPADGALKTLLAAGSPVDVDAFSRWSQRRKAAQFADTSPRPPLSIAAQQRMLGAHDAVVDYVLLDSVAAAIVVTANRAAVVTLPIATEAIARRVAAMRAPFTAYNGRVDLARLTFDASSAAALYAALVQPIDSLIRGATRLIVVPDGPLHLLPFDALVTNAGSARTFLIERYEISYLPSVTLLRKPTVVTLSGKPLLFVGFGVDGDTAEWSAIAKTWRGPAQRLLGRDANQERLRGTARSAGIMHFAVHARASESDPLASHLELAPTPESDGMLDAAAIERAHMAPSLVVLSACETDAGLLLHGVGAMGLARAFLVAGARGVIGTEWSVGPASLGVMSVFYRRLADGDQPAAALRAAKLELLQASPTSNPFYWAPFTLTEVP